jgi:glycine C-acetyltransferase
VRFICGTFDCHHSLEARIAEFYGVEASYTFTSCWNANEAIFPTLCEAGDIIISDELNHASIIDGIRLAAVIKKGRLKTVYRHNDLASLRAQGRGGSSKRRTGSREARRWSRISRFSARSAP